METEDGLSPGKKAPQGEAATDGAPVPPTRAGGERIRATVAYARPEHQWLVEVDLDGAPTIRDAVEASKLMELAAKFEPDGIFGVGINCKKLDWNSPVRDGDRVEIYRPLKEDPRNRRRRLAQEENPGR